MAPWAGLLVTIAFLASAQILQFAAAVANFVMDPVANIVPERIAVRVFVEVFVEIGHLRVLHGAGAIA